MNPKRIVWPLLLVILVLARGLTAVFAQETPLQLRLTRDFGSGFGTNIQGRFSMIVEGPDDLDRVVFLLDDEIMAEQTSPPFRYQFQTENYPAGQHTLQAVGYTADGRELNSNQISRTFITGGESRQRLVYLIVPLLILVIGGRLLTSWIANRGQAEKTTIPINGAYGGAICPKCNKPFARHWWAPNLMSGKFDRCPHCKKWSFVSRAHPDLLQASYEAMIQAEQAQPNDEKSAPPDDDDLLQKRLDDSRFDS